MCSGCGRRIDQPARYSSLIPGSASKDVSRITCTKSARQALSASRFGTTAYRRAVKFALGRHWHGEVGADALEATGAELRARHWAEQAQAGLDFVTVGDFAFYDHVANHIQLFGCEPARFGFTGTNMPMACAAARPRAARRRSR